MKNLVVLTGAGMSAESGISTFRDAGGLWERYPVEQVATPEGYAADPELVINFYNERRKQLLDVRPNRGHELLAQVRRFILQHPLDIYAYVSVIVVVFRVVIISAAEPISCGIPAVRGTSERGKT